MLKKLFKKIHAKERTVKNELRRAHAMIVLLSLALMAVLGVGITDGAELNTELTYVVMVLLVVVVIVSLSVILALNKKR